MPDHVCTLQRSYQDGWFWQCACGMFWAPLRGELLTMRTVSPALRERLRAYRLNIEWGDPGGLAAQVRHVAEMERGRRQLKHDRARADWERRQSGKRKRRREYLLTRPCAYCGGTATEIDHVIPRNQDGTDAHRNLAPACSRCNSEKSGRTPAQWQGWRLNLGRSWPPENSDHILALASYRFPDGDDPQARRMLRFDAAREVRRIERLTRLAAYERESR